MFWILLLSLKTMNDIDDTQVRRKYDENGDNIIITGNKVPRKSCSYGWSIGVVEICSFVQNSSARVELNHATAFLLLVYHDSSTIQIRRKKACTKFDSSILREKGTLKQEVRKLMTISRVTTFQSDRAFTTNSFERYQQKNIKKKKKAHSLSIRQFLISALEINQYKFIRPIGLSLQ